MDFTDYFTTTVKFEKNYDPFNLKFSCIKEKQIFADAAAVTACTANYRPDPFDLLNANIEVLAQEENPNCENGCLDNGNGCYCNLYYPYYKEAIW